MTRLVRRGQITTACEEEEEGVMFTVCVCVCEFRRVDKIIETPCGG